MIIVPGTSKEERVNVQLKNGDLIKQQQVKEEEEGEKSLATPTPGLGPDPLTTPTPGLSPDPLATPTLGLSPGPLEDMSGPQSVAVSLSQDV